MSRISRLVVSTALSFAAIFGTSIAAGAHGAPLPIGHIGLTHLGRLPFTTHGVASHFAANHLPISSHSHIATPFLGAGSLSTRVNAYTIKSIQIAGITNGENFAITQQIGGAISSGLLNGQLYTTISPTDYFAVGTYSYAIGNNPYNVGGSGITFPAASPGSGNYLTFTNSGTSTLKHA